MCRKMSKSRGLKLRRYDAHLLDHNNYMVVFTGEKSSEKTCVAELNEFFFDRMPKRWIKQAYMQGIDWKYITFKEYLNMLESIEI